MRVRAAVVGTGFALAMVFSAQTAQAQACPPTGGDGDMQIELPGDGTSCDQGGGGPAFLSTEVQNANGVSYSVDAVVPDGNEYLQIGEVVEVSIDYDDVMASLRANEKGTVALASALGMRSSGKKGKINADIKLNDSEYHAVAEFVHVAVQRNGRSTGRSDPATNSFVKRVEAAGQAFERAMNAIGRNLPSFSGFVTIRTYHPNGQVQTEVQMGAEVSRK